MEMSGCVKAVVVAANHYMNNPSEGLLVPLQRQIDVLISMTTKGSLVAHFNPHELASTECIACMVQILGNPDVKSSLSQKCLLLLTNIANVETIRVALHSTYNLTAGLAKYLHRRTTPCYDASDVTVLQCVKLLFQLTYNCRISCQEIYVEDLMNFTLKHILSTESELTQPCYGLLANLCRHNFSVQSLVKNHENLRTIQKALFRALNNVDQRTIAFSLTVLFSLCHQHEEIGQSVFQPKNIKKTFQTLINILGKNDSTTTRRYVVDLLTDIIHLPRAQPLVIQYENLDSCINEIFKLIKTESAGKVLELLLSFCSVNELRSKVCRKVLECPALQDSSRYKELLTDTKAHTMEPLFAVVHLASRPVETHNQTPILALKFLREVYQEVMDLGLLDQLSLRTDLVLPMTTNILMDPIKMSAPQAKEQCVRVVRALQLLIALCGEPSLQPAVAKSLDAKTCLGLVEHQLNLNKIAFSKISKTTDPEDCSVDGVEVLIYSLDLILAIRRLVPTLESSFHALIQDTRVVPFLSFAITSQKRKLVQISLKLFTHGSALAEFPTVILGEYISAQNAKSVRRVEYKERSMDNGDEPAHKRFAWGKTDTSSMVSNSSMKTLKQEMTNRGATVDSLIERMQSGLELKDMRTSEIIGVFEHKLLAIQSNESNLQDLLEAKTLNLSHAERLITQYRCRQAQSEAETYKMRELMGDSERRAELMQEQLAEAEADKIRLTTDVEQLCSENQRLEAIATEHTELTETYQNQSQKLEALQRRYVQIKESYESENERHELLKRHHETLKQQHNEATEQLSVLEEQNKNLTRITKETDAQLSELKKKHTKTLETFTKENTKLEKTVDQQRQELNKTELAKKEIQNQLTTLEVVCQNHEEAIQEKDLLIRAQKTELDKHAQIAALIHNLSGGKPPCKSENQ